MTDFLIYRFARGRMPEYVRCESNAQAALTRADDLNAKVEEGEHDGDESVKYSVFTFEKGRYQHVRRAEPEPQEVIE